MPSFFQTVTDAINDVIEYGYEREERLQYWIEQIKFAAEADMIDEATLDTQLRRVLGDTYKQLIDKGSILPRHEGVDRFTLAQIAPKLRAELDRRIMASASLIRLNREQAMAETLRRFEGWATSIPAGGTAIADRRDVKGKIRKELTSLPYAERRVIIDQGHKLTSALSEIIANDQGALAAQWHSHWRQAGYDYRPDHKHRDGVVYLVRDSWAHQQGLVKPGPQGFFDEHERPGEWVFCRCWVRWIYALRALPKALLTDKGTAALAEVREQMKAAG